MKVDKVLIIEDATVKYMDIYKYLRRRGVSDIDHARNAEDALAMVEDAIENGHSYDLIVSDMHFDYFGIDDEDAGEKTLKLFREKGYSIPTIICSSRNWKITGVIGNIFYNPRRNWEAEADKLFDQITSL